MCEEARKRAEAAVTAVGTSAVSGAGSRASTPAPLGAPVDPKAIAGEIFGVPTVAPDSVKLAADAVRRSEEEEDEKQKRQQRADDIRRVREGVCVSSVHELHELYTPKGERIVIFVNGQEDSRWRSGQY